jgi:glutaconate CoA-transferase subunit A
MQSNSPFSNKVMTTEEAVRSLIKDGDSLAIGNFLTSLPFAIVHEIIRQRKKNLELISQSGIEEIELLLGGGCLNRISTAYNYRSGGKEAPTELERSLKKASKGKLDLKFEDYTNFTLLARLMAGALGYTFIPVLPAIEYSDVFKINTYQKDKFKVINCPFTGKRTVVIPALNPDVAIVHVQRADKYGNAQYWGSIGNSKWANLAAKKIIVSCEEIVDHEIIQHNPAYTIIPGFRVNAVVVEPWGAHPSELSGYYCFDVVYRAYFFLQDRSASGLSTYMKEWIYGVKNRSDYIDLYVDKFGSAKLNELKPTSYFTSSVNYGYAPEIWNEKQFCRYLNITKGEFLEKLDRLGAYYEVCKDE